MIPITCDLARRFRNVVRRSLLESCRTAWPVVVARLRNRVVSLEAVQNDFGVRFVLDCDPDVATAGDCTVAFRADVLAQFSGPSSGVVILQEPIRGKAKAMWRDRGSAGSVEFDAVGPDEFQPFPETDVRLNPLNDDFFQALGEAVQTAAKESIKQGLTRILLRGKGGEMIASDSRQLLIRRGYPFPWNADILIPRVPAFATKDLVGEVPIGIGHSDKHVVLRLGNWTFALPIDADSRFPQIEAVIPNPRSIRSRLQFDPKDAAELLAALPRMPGRGTDNDPVTLDLSSPPAVRARDEPDGPVAEVVLGRSSVSGPPAVVVTDRALLRRVLEQGFGEVQVASPDKPLVCRDASRIYVWMPLEASGAIERSAAKHRVLPPANGASAPTPSRPRRVTPTSPAANGHSTNPIRTAPQKLGPADVIAEATTVRGLLKDAGSRLANLVRALKHQRHQTRAVQQAVQSLRQLQLDK